MGLLCGFSRGSRGRGQQGGIVVRVFKGQQREGATGWDCCAGFQGAAEGGGNRVGLLCGFSRGCNVKTHTCTCMRTRAPPPSHTAGSASSVSDLSMSSLPPLTPAGSAMSTPGPDTQARGRPAEEQHGCVRAGGGRGACSGEGGGALRH